MKFPSAKSVGYDFGVVHPSVCSHILVPTFQILCILSINDTIWKVFVKIESLTLDLLPITVRLGNYSAKAI